MKIKSEQVTRHNIHKISGKGRLKSEDVIRQWRYIYD